MSLTLTEQFTQFMQRKTKYMSRPNRKILAGRNLNLSMKIFMLEADVQRQWRKKGMRVTIIRIVMNFPPGTHR